MGTDGIFQLKKPFPPQNRSPAQKDVRLDTHILHFLDADDLIDVDTEQLMLPVLQAQPQRADIPTSAAHRDHVHRTHFRLHIFTPRFLFYYNTFVRI